MAMSYDLTLKDGDQKTFSLVIMLTLQKNAGNIELFNGGSFFSKPALTLFDARKIKRPPEFAQKLWEVIHRALLESMTECLVLYPLPRIKSRLFSLGFDGISLMPADDNKAWQDLHEKYGGIRLWEPLTGDLRGGQKIPHTIAQYRLAPPLTWLACELTGTKDGSLKHSKKRMSKFLSVLFSHLMVRKPQILDKILVDIPSPIFRFLDQKLLYSFTSPISYLLRDDLEILEEDFESINHWYTEYRKISENRRKKVELCTLSIQKAMVNRNEIEFIYYFIALDALFGQRYDVKSSIACSVCNVFDNNYSWKEKAEWLFDLRSDLLHGGSSEIEDWEKLPRYNINFKTEPLDDVAIAALSSLRIYPELSDADVSLNSGMLEALKRLVNYFRKIYFRALSISNPT
jgi:hypothetical protein